MQIVQDVASCHLVQHVQVSYASVCGKKLRLCTSHLMCPQRIERLLPTSMHALLSAFNDGATAVRYTTRHDVNSCCAIVTLV
jgi:hypothetical protein